MFGKKQKEDPFEARFGPEVSEIVAVIDPVSFCILYADGRYTTVRVNIRAWQNMTGGKVDTSREFIFIAKTKNAAKIARELGDPLVAASVRRSGCAFLLVKIRDDVDYENWKEVLGEMLASAPKSDHEACTPIANSDHLGSFEEAPADIARRARSIAALEEKGIPYMPELYVAVPEAEAKLRAPEEIARRLLAMFGVCVYSEARGGGEKWEGAQKYLRKIDALLGGGLDDALTPNEKTYLAEKKPAQQNLVNFSWRYECCHVLLWALGIFEELGWPDKICDVSRMGKLIWNLDGLADLLERAKMRSWEELLDAADLILRCDWACVDGRINGRENPAGLDGGVAMEWHRALEWLVGGCEGTDWDDVRTDT